MNSSEAESERYFRDLLRDVIEPTAPYGIVGGGEAMAATVLDAGLVARLHDRARLLAVAPASIVHAAWALVVARTSGKDDVVFGTTRAGETLPVRIRLATARETVVEADRQLAELARLAGATRALAERCSGLSGDVPLFTASLELRDFALTVRAPGDMDRILEMTSLAIEQLVGALERDPATTAWTIDVMSPAERQRLLVEWNATDRDYPRTRCIHQLFEERVVVCGDAPAVIFEDVTVSYARLNADANRLARHLVALGVRPGERVAILLPRSIELVVSQLAILKCGAAYVPLDEHAPAERNAFMVADCGTRVVLTRALLDALSLETYASDNLDLAIESDAAAYVMYTSGSTGEPKGCVVAHRSVGRLVFDNGYLPFTADDRVAFVSNPAFDASMIEVWAPLYTGGAIVVIDRDTLLDPNRFARALEARGVTILSLTVALFNRYAAMIPDAFTRLRCLIVGGDKVDATIIADVVRTSPPARFVHAYGPTETTLFATTYHVVQVPAGASSIPIGRPISNTQIYILDPRGRPTPIGVAGELFIGGEGVALGYLNRPELTAERFVPDPFRGGRMRMYRTGDLARYLPDGNIEFLGRNDTQIKIRGFRVELGEIETRIMAFGGIDEAVVNAIDEGGGNKRLVAYCTGQLDVGRLKQHLRATLPEYMVPSAYVRLDAFPLTANLKIDRRALPVPALERTQPLIAPAGPTEELVAGIWREVLGIEDLGVCDSFFELGGHSLVAIQIVSRIRDATGVGLAIRAFFDAPTIRGLANAIAGASQVEVEVIPKRSQAEPAPLSSPQEQLWFVHALDPVSAAYNIPLTLRLRGPLDVDVLARSIDEVVRRHDVLRTTIAGGHDVPHQRVSPPAPCRLRAEPVEDVLAAEALAAAEVRRSFDLEKGPLIRTRLLRIDASDHLLVVTMHHIVSDAWSCGVFQRELLETYASRPLPELAIQFADYASWERTRALAGSLAYWRAHLAGAPLVLDLPTDRTRPPVQTFAGARHELVLSAKSLDAIAKLCRAEGVTPFMTLFAVFGVLLHRYTGQDKILVGVPVANRTRTDTEQLIGMFVNTLAVAADLSGDPTFRELLHRVRGATLGGFAHQELPFAKLVEELQPPRDSSRSPVVQVMFAYQSAAIQPPTRAAGLTVTRLGRDTGTSKFELMLELEPLGSELAGWVEYNTDLFDAATIARFVAHFEVLVEALVTDPAARVSEVSLHAPAERLVSRIAAPREPVVEQIERCMRETPDAPAILWEGRAISYRELDARSARLAAVLRDRTVGPDRIVPVIADRGPAQIVGFLGVLRAGGAYLPIKPDLPGERIAWMIEDAAPAVILCDGPPPPGLAVVRLDEPETWSDPPTPAPPAVPLDALAYVIYTSGSTGRPKGVMVSRRNFDAQLRWMQAEYRLAADDRVLQLASSMFDFSVLEIFWPLMVGAAVVLPRAGGELEPAYLVSLADRHAATIVHFVPSLFRVVLDACKATPWRTIKMVFCGGEALSLDLVRGSRTVFPNAELENQYGPTETTINATYWRCHPDDPTVPIGRAVADTTLYVLDHDLAAIPTGGIGELWIGGIQVTRGYLKRSALTAERFLPDPFAIRRGERMYRTGDLVRQRPDGVLEYVGRADLQVKLRGYRIELGEIEVALCAHPAVKQAVCTVRQEPAQLVAYVEWRADALPELDRFLGERLPAYMIPSVYVAIERWPITPSGKLDRSALPAPTNVDRGEVAPLSALEHQVAAIWAELLHVTIRGPDADFFELGGTSLLAMRATFRMNRETGHNLPVLAMLQARTVRRVAELLAAPDGGTTSVIDLPAVSARRDQQSWPLTFSQRMAWEITHRGRQSAFEVVRGIFELEGRLDRNALRRAVDAIVLRHPSLRARFAGTGNDLVQMVDPAPSYDWHELDVASGVRGMSELLERPFDLTAGPVMRCALASENDRHWFGFAVHHIACDGGSLPALFADLARAYRQLASGQEVSWSDRALALADVAAWEQVMWRAHGPAMATYWRTQLAGARPPTLPVSDWSGEPDLAPVPAISCSFRLTGPAVDQLRAAAAAVGSTPFLVALTSLGATLRALTGADEVCIASPYMRRDLEGTSGVVGYMAHPLLFRLDWPPDASFARSVAHTSERVLGAYHHGHVPLMFGPDVMPDLPSDTALGGESLYRIFFNYLNFTGAALDLGPELRAKPVNLGPERETRFPLMIFAVETAASITWNLSAQARCYRPEQLSILAERIEADLVARCQ